MASFSTAELRYLAGERRLGRLATVDADGLPHVVPVGMWRHNAELGSIDITGHGFASSHKFHNVQATNKAAFVVDDLASVDPWHPRAIMVRGRAEAVDETPTGGQALVRIFTDSIVSWGIEPDKATVS